MTNKTATIPALKAGARLRQYEILRPLTAEGGQAHVYLARVWRDGQLPAEQLLRRMASSRTDLASVVRYQLCVIKLAQPGWVENLRDEHTYLRDPRTRHERVVALFHGAETTSERQHEPRGLGFVTLVDSAGRPLELPYIVLHYYPGGSLKELLVRRERRPLPPPVAVNIAGQVARALLHLHKSAGLVHHDVSPSNIVFRRPLSALRATTPDCVLIDLAAADAPAQPRQRRIYGKTRYLPPERLATPPQRVDYSVDVYGLGVSLYEMLAGRLPEVGTDAVTRLPRPLPPLADHCPGASQALAELVMAAISPSAQDRPSMKSFADRLEGTPEARRPGTLRGPWDRKTALALVASLATALLLIVVLAGVLSVVAGPPVAPPAAPAPPARPSATLIPEPTVTPTPSPVPMSTFAPPTSQEGP